MFVEFGTSTAYGLQTAIYEVTAGTTVPILVAGMKPSTAYHMRAKLQIDGKVAWIDNDRVFTTGALSVPPPTITVTPGGASGEAPGVELISFAAPAGSPPVLQALVTDRDRRRTAGNRPPPVLGHAASLRDGRPRRGEVATRSALR